MLATFVCASAQASPVQVADGDYSGEASIRGTGFQAFENNVSFTVFSGGTGLRGVIQYVVDSSIEFNGERRPLCLRLAADFLSAPIAINGSGASGSVLLEQSFTDGTCSSTTVFDSPLMVNADIAVVFNGPTMTGTLTLPAEVPFVVDLRAERGGLEATSSTNAPPVAGIEEFIDGTALTDETAARLKELAACTQADFASGGRCDFSASAEGLQTFQFLVGLRLDKRLQDDDELARAAFVSTLRDPSGNLLCPSLGPMFPVLVALRERSATEPSAEVALNRLVGLIIAMDVDARQ
jgi:hypothetical protein